MKKHAIVILLLGLCQTLSAAAHTHPEVGQLLALRLEEVLATKVSISTHTQQTLSKAPSVVSVITAEDIKVTGATNLAEILQSVPGIYVMANLFGFEAASGFT
ncbi:MAG: TonB-dependent receptor plug domain-containing protein [Rhodocyclaceae bacterium]|nr:TonB-dependent receptor plug domain-containing protein [Rhodocyclaceae bacterium]MDP1957553.1 TonB-dependent receptor plug domain-containing protein [Rhodocyclaceae bacterium]